MTNRDYTRKHDVPSVEDVNTVCEYVRQMADVLPGMDPIDALEGVTEHMLNEGIPPSLIGPTLAEWRAAGEELTGEPDSPAEAVLTRALDA